MLQRTGAGIQTALVFPKDRPNRMVLGGLAALILSLFLPWVYAGLPDFLGSGASNIDLSPISRSAPVWLLAIVLVASSAFILYQGWLYQNKPQTPRWLLIIPLVIGTFMTAVSLYTIVLVMSLQSIAGDLTANLISSQFGVYLALLGGIVLAVGGYQKFLREYMILHH